MAIRHREKTTIRFIFGDFERLIKAGHDLCALLVLVSPNTILCTHNKGRPACGSTVLCIDYSFQFGDFDEQMHTAFQLKSAAKIQKNYDISDFD